MLLVEDNDDAPSFDYGISFFLLFFGVRCRAPEEGRNRMVFFRLQAAGRWQKLLKSLN